jgi:CHAT domain-containing protein
LLVVPHRALALVPFTALPVNGRLLGEQMVVSVLPSAALVTRPGAARRPRLEGTALLVGDPACAADRRLPRLPGAATEVATIARLLGIPDPLLDADATEAEVVRRIPGRPIVHLAAHGMVYERGPNRSYVALAGRDELTVGDVMGLDLAADLVVLSACHTGRGTATAGGDVVGLVRAVIAAGARHAVVSLWPVDDEAGCLVMTAMYERLVAGDDVAQALTCAQQWVRGLDGAARRSAYDTVRERADGQPANPGARDARPLAPAPSEQAGLPYHWAPFVHVGL